MRCLLALALLLAACMSSLKEGALARSPALAAAWIGVASDGVTWYRLDLDDEGTGTAAVTKGTEVDLYRARWSDDRESVTIHLELLDGAPDAARRIDLAGTSRSFELELDALGLHSVTLWRERDLLAARERMIGHSTTTANPP
jgi:hypothetical protein